MNGNNLKLALDIRLQEVADKLFGNRRGALVAIDPQTGGVLAFLSKPGFDPNLFIDGIDSQSWAALNSDWQKPMINRALRLAPRAEGLIYFDHAYHPLGQEVPRP